MRTKTTLTSILVYCAALAMLMALPPAESRLGASSGISAASDPGECPRDSKLIGRVSVFGDENEASWWRLIHNGMVAFGLTDPDDQRDYLNGVFGTEFATLDEVRLFNLQGVSQAYDKNGNGFVCAFELRGTRAYNTDPLFEFTWFGVSDDRER